MLKRFGLMLFLAAFVLLLNSSYGQDDNKNINFKAITNAKELKAGETFIIRLSFDIKEHWYTYSMKMQLNDEGIGPTATEITMKNTDLFEFSPESIIAQKPVTKFDEGFEMNIEVYKHDAVFILVAKAKQDFTLESGKEKVLVYLQQCDTARCLPPTEFEVPIEYTDEAVSSTLPESKEDKVEKKEDKAFQTDATSEIEEVKKKGVMSFLWFAMGAGALALLTPCVFPMIPITVSFFTKRAEQEKGKGVRDASLYAIGIMATFTALGMILAAVFGATGIRDFATNGWVNMFIAAIFIVFAFNLFGAFEIQMPTGLMNKLNTKSQGSGIVSVLLMGLTFSLTSFTCTVPFVGTTLISTANGEWFYPIIGMIGFSGVFAAPFFLLALFPTVMQKMPKAGGWMNNVKVVMGFLEIAAAIKFISNADLVWKWGVMSPQMFLAIWIACAIMIVLYILGKFKLPHDAPTNAVGPMRITFATIFLTITFYLFSGLFGDSLGELDAFLPPPNYSEMMSDVSGAAVVTTAAASSSNAGDSKSMKDRAMQGWLKDYQQGLDLAKKENKPLFVDFTGFTCTNCRWMETKMFPKSNVLDKMEQMVRVKLFTDRNEEPYISNKKLQEEKFGSIELPLYVILTPEGEFIATNTFTRDEAQFLEFLDKGLNAVK
jgi:thiol:disulfide interchange protein DsbD